MTRTRIETERLLLRPLDHDDLEALVAIYGDPAFNAALHNEEPPGLLEMAHLVQWQQELEESFGYSQWGVVERSGGELVGDCGFFPFQWQGPEVELAYHIRRDRWGRGYASEAAAAALAWARRNIRRSLLAVTHPDNTASRRVLARIGMTELGQRICYGTEMVAYGPGWSGSAGED